MTPWGQIRFWGLKKVFFGPNKHKNWFSQKIGIIWFGCTLLGTPTVPSYKVPLAVLVENSFNQKYVFRHIHISNPGIFTSPYCDCVTFIQYNLKTQLSSCYCYWKLKYFYWLHARLVRVYMWLSIELIMGTLFTAHWRNLTWFLPKAVNVPHIL